MRIFEVVDTTDFKRGGTKILWRGEPWLIVEFQHVKPGKGGAFVRTKLKNLITGRILEETFRDGEKFKDPDLKSKRVQYLSEDGNYHFMDQEDYEQITLHLDQVKTVKDYLKENEIYKIVFFEGKPISVETPLFMKLKVVDTPPGVRGDTAQGGATKPATLESGLVVQVPLFINEGETIKIDTRSGEYIERCQGEE